MKRALRLAGLLLAAGAGLYFVGYAYRSLAGRDLSMLLDPTVLAASVGLTAVYALLVPVTALAWAWWLRGLGEPASFARLAPILATTQFGKYLPGNVAHHIGRVALARSRGFRTGAVVASLGYETLLTVVACVHVSALTFLWSVPRELGGADLAQWRWHLVLGITAGALAILSAAPWLAATVARLRGGGRDGTSIQAAPRPGTHPVWTTTLACYLAYCLNFGLVGAGLWWVAGALSPEPLGGPAFLLLTGAFASSWILGFLVPGAPAGLGVREAVLSVWVGVLLDPAAAVAVIVILRLATTVGDLATFAWGALLLGRGSSAPG